MSSITAKSSLTGTITGENSLSGALSSPGSLSGNLSVPQGTAIPTYAGDYEVIPSVTTEQILSTANMVLTKDIVVAVIPYYETSNTSNGKTVYIGSTI